MGLAGVLEVDLAIPSAVCAGHSDHPQATFWSAQDWRRRTSPPARSGAQRSAYQIVELSVGDARGVCRPELDGLLPAADPVCRRPVGQRRFGVRAHRHDQPMRAIKYRPVLAVHLVAVAATARRRAPPAGRPGGQDGYGRGQALIGRALYLRLGVKQSFVVRGVLLAGGGSPTSGWARLQALRTRRRTGDPSRSQRAGVVLASTVLRAASAETTATMAVTRLIRDAFCDCVSCHQANPILKASVADTKAVTVPATATGCFLVCGHR